MLSAIILACTAWLVGCAAAPGDRGTETQGVRIQPISLNSPVEPAVLDRPVALAAAKNEWTSFQLRISGLPDRGERVAYTLRVQSLNLVAGQGTIGAEHFRAYQILPMPVDVNRAGYVRHTGLSAATRMMPRALLPMPINQGRINLSAARDPEKPTDPNSRAGGKPVMLWIDLHVPPEALSGEYAGVCEVFATGGNRPLARMQIRLEVYNFVIPDERHLSLVGEIEWQSLSRLYPDRFEAVTPRLMNRQDPRYSAAIRTLDELVTMAHEHRVEAVVPRLCPSVKWPGGRPPVVFWEDFDSVVKPWLSGQMFADKVPAGYWPLPPCDGLNQYDPKSRSQYWSEAATHFDQNDWLERSPVMISKPTPGRATAMESVKISADAAELLECHPRLLVAVPLEDDQVQFADASNPRLIDPQHSHRLITANPPIVFSSPVQNWPAGLARPRRWLRTDLGGLSPYFGAGGDECDVRLWAWFSFLPLPPPRLGVQYGPVWFVRWSNVLPRESSPAQPADPNELVWFYPGSWFGVDHPLPTIQLKWLRRAQQDFEYLHLARQRGDAINALFMARLMTKPVELQPTQQPDPTYGLMCGTADPATWDQAIDLLARRILLREPGQPIDKDKDFRLNIQTLQWSQPQERPVIMGRSTVWTWDASGRQKWINLRLGIDIYNASDSTPDENLLGWSAVPENSAWQVRPQPMTIPALATYQVQRFALEARIDPDRLRRAEHRPVEIVFTNGFTRKTSQVQMVLPVAATERREGLLKLDGLLDDWSDADAIQDGPLVQMFARPTLQSHKLQFASLPAQIYTGWADENFYVAFRVGGALSSPATVVRNFVNYQVRRAWGEDVCQVLVQAVYADNTVGPILHVACKPTANWVERKLDPRLFADPWQALEGAKVRYVATLNAGQWQGEIAIPWKAINDQRTDMPVMLRFNFTHHRQDSGQSASWAGPIDFGRDDAFMGLLVLREPDTPGMIRTAGE